LEKDLISSGTAKYKSGDLNGAIDDFNKAIALNPDKSRAYGARGTIKNIQ